MNDRSVITVIPAAQKDRYNAILEAQGLGPDNIAQPASADGKAPATHFFGHGWETDAGEAMVTELKAGRLPASLKDADLSSRSMTRRQAEDAGKAVALATEAYRGDSPRARVDAVLTVMGLKAIEPDSQRSAEVVKR